MSQSGFDNNSNSTNESSDDEPLQGQPLLFPNKLVANFALSGDVQLLRECPHRVNLTVMAPPELTSPTKPPRIDTIYNFVIRGTLNLESLRGRRIVSDDGDGRIVLQVILCDVANSGFCSPFVHEQSNARLAAEGKKTGSPPGTLHGGTHIHSQSVFLNLPTNETIVHFSKAVPLRPVVSGEFFTIGYVQFFTTESLTGNASSIPLTRYDIANAAHEPIVSFHPHPRIEQVSLVVEISVALLAGLASLVILFLLYQTYIHRKHQIMKLSQGKFLMILLVSALVGSISIVFINPKNDLYCKLFPPLAYIPGTTIYAVAIARVWRAQALLNPLLQEFYKSRFTSGFSSLIDVLACSWQRKQNNKRLRRTVSDGQMMLVISILTLPQVILQIVAETVQARHVGIRFDEDQATGSTFCVNGAGDQSFFSVTTGCFSIVVILSLMLLLVSQASRKLPSLFNEMKDIVAMSVFNVLVLIIGSAVIRVSARPGSSPSVTLLLWGSVVLSLTLNSSLRLVLPKLQMVRRNKCLLVRPMKERMLKHNFFFFLCKNRFGVVKQCW